MLEMSFHHFRGIGEVGLWVSWWVSRFCKTFLSGLDENLEEEVEDDEERGNLVLFTFFNGF